jgi:KipI family sensor histidine kinase inhibitor
MRLLAFGDAAVLVEFDAPDAVLPFIAALHSRPPGVLDVVPAERTVLVRFDPRQARLAAIARWLRGVNVQPTARLGGPVVEIGVHYDGEDLAEVARLTGLTEREVIAAHTGSEWVVAFSGFAPGFGYLRPAGHLRAAGHLWADKERLDVPRRDESRVRVPAGAVALAAGYSGVYPRSSPGGWQLIGRTPAVLWDVDREPPALLRPGVRVRFHDLAEAR